VRFDRGELGLADLFIRLARSGKLEGSEDEDVRNLEGLIAERLKQKAAEEVR